MAEPTPIHGITIQRLTVTDAPVLHQLLEVYQEAFGLKDFTPPPMGHLADLLHDKKIVFMAALRHGRVVGGLTAYILPSVYAETPEAYLYDLAIGTPWRRRGIGTALLAALKQHCGGIGIEEIFVQADRPDKHAIDFYTRNGGIPGDVIHFSFAITSRQP